MIKSHVEIPCKNPHKGTPDAPAVGKCDVYSCNYLNPELTLARDQRLRYYGAS